MGRDRDGRGYVFSGDWYICIDLANDGDRAVEFETYDDLKRAIAHLDGSEYNGYHVTCQADVHL